MMRKVYIHIKPMYILFFNKQNEYYWEKKEYKGYIYPYPVDLVMHDSLLANARRGIPIN